MGSKTKRYFVENEGKDSPDELDDDFNQLLEEISSHSKNDNKKSQKSKKGFSSSTTTEAKAEQPEFEIKNIIKYQKEPIKLDGLVTKFQKKKFFNKRKQFELNAQQAARAELLLPEDAGYIEAEEGETTSSVTQKQIVNAVDITSASKHFDLDLKKFGPYRINYTKNGRFLVLGGRMGHVAAIDWVTKDLLCEINVMEPVSDVQWFHNELMFAAAQKRFTYVYDSQGVELHCLKMLDSVLRLEFLPYHFLLVAASATSFLQWVDVSIGKLVAAFPTKIGPLDVMCQNPANAIVHCGQSRGIVSLWSPNVREPLVKISCHSNPIRGLTVDQSGLYMATAGCDKSVKIWDLRMFKALHDYKLPRSAEPIVFSQRRTLACASGTEIQIYKDICTKTVTSPYLTHRINEMVTDLQFCPYEDVLGVGHRSGFTSLLVPGAGEPNVDAFEANPYQSKRQRREAEVKSLLDKIQPEMITLDSDLIVKVDSTLADEKMTEQLLMLYKNKPEDMSVHLKHKAKGKSSGAHSFRRKQLVKESRKKEFLNEQKRIRQELKDEGILEDHSEKKVDLDSVDVLDRFKRKNI